MDDIYLNQHNKRYYYSDFVENVLTETDDFWKINDTIKPYLIELNECKTIQPLYSKFSDNKHSFEGNQSYLKLAYAKDVELTLFRQILPDLIIRYTQDDSKFYYTFSEPKDNANFVSVKSRFKLGCLTNPDYFRINHLRLVFEEYNKSKQKEFWDDLVNKLKKIK